MSTARRRARPDEALERMTNDLRTLIVAQLAPEDRAWMATRLIAGLDAMRRDVVAERGRAVLRLLDSGWSLRQIADALGLSPTAVVTIRDQARGLPRAPSKRLVRDQPGTRPDGADVGT